MNGRMTSPRTDGEMLAASKSSRSAQAGRYPDERRIQTRYEGFFGMWVVPRVI
ncbi:hypothetical protein E6C60_1303 [Paenibacillus algicola]|uniref:Uncharacterized protein n=1 Tax=Paenibacillus algicola TaxID=2565926 RepID=A0A4P8XNX7_9BACL|nr:hypothetical protein E6C60_1303 [Paenibacillus algicola]